MFKRTFRSICLNDGIPNQQFLLSGIKVLTINFIILGIIASLRSTTSFSREPWKLRLAAMTLAHKYLATSTRPLKMFCKILKLFRHG